VTFVRTEIHTERLLLRPHRPEDAADVRAYADDPTAARWLPLLPSPYTADDARWWVEEGSPAAWVQGCAQFAVVERASGRVVGGVGVPRVSWAAGVGEVGYVIGALWRGRGYATEAVVAVTDWAFAHGIARMELTPDPANVASQRVAAAAGFTREGMRRSAGPARGGGRADQVVWVRLPGDPPGPSVRTLPDFPADRLTDGVVLLRPWTPADAPVLHAIESDPEVVRWRVRTGPPPSVDAVARRIELAPAEWLAGDHVRCAVVDVASGAVAGSVGMWVESRLAGLGNLGYAIGPGYRGRGLATRAARLLADWGLGPAGLARVHAGAAVENTPSRRVLERAGFAYEGVLRSYLPAVGGRQDVALYARLPEPG
jgi:RimJ/RimL family protein N-acetyltransferase